MKDWDPDWDYDLNEDLLGPDDPRTHYLKTHPEPFEEVWGGRKQYEIRKNDRGFKVRDTLALYGWDPRTEKYTGRVVRALVTYMTPGGEWGLPVGLCCMSIQTKLKHTHFPPRDPRRGLSNG